MDKIFRLVLDENSGLPITGLTVRAVRIEDNETYPMEEIAGTDGAGKYVSTVLVPAGSYRLQKFVGGVWISLTETGDVTDFVVEVEPGIFNQLAPNDEDGVQFIEKSQVLREVIHVAAFVPGNTAGGHSHIVTALNFAATGPSQFVPRKVVVGNCRNNSTWNMTGTITVPDYVELDLAGAVLSFAGSDSSAAVALGEGSRLTNGTVAYNGSGSALTCSGASRGALVTADIVRSNGASTSCPATHQITFLSANTFAVNDPIMVDPWSSTSLESNPEALISAAPVNLSGRSNTSLLSAKLKPSDLQAFFYRLCSPFAKRGALPDFLTSPFSTDDAMSGEQVGRALREIIKRWGTLLNGTHRSQFKSTTNVAFAGSGLLQAIVPVGQSGQSLTIPANGLQVGSSISGRIHFHTGVSGFTTNLAQLRLSIGSAYADLYFEASSGRSVVVEWNAKIISGSIIGYAKITNSTLGTVETSQWAGAIDVATSNAFSAQLKLPNGSNATVQVYDLVVDK